MLEQNVNAPIGQRYSRWWAAYGGTSATLPLVMADSGHQYGYGPVDSYTVYKGYLDAELARPPGAELAARAVRLGNRFRVSVTLVNHSGVTLSSANGATVHVIVYEDIKIGVTSRMVRDAVYLGISSAVASSASASYVLETHDIAPSDWSRVHVVALVDYRPGGTTGAYDMLQAAFATIAVPPDDFDGDGTSDILWRHATRGEVWLWTMKGATNAAETYVRTVGDTGWQIRSVGDHDGNGSADLIWRQSTTGQLYFWPMKSMLTVAEIAMGVVDPAFDIVGTGDYDGDGRSDLLWRHQTTGEVWLWLMNGATTLSVAYVDTVDLAYALKGSGDLNADGRADLVWQGATGDVWVWLMNGPDVSQVAYVGTVGELDYRIVGVADYTGDGRADLLWHHATRGEIWLWELNGTTATSAAYVGTVPDVNYQIAGTGDYDGNGRADILWRHATAGDVWVWLMDGAVKQSEHYVGTVPDTGYRIIK